jgi:UDP-N-acetylmuramoyl-tripeptide--D-alanyl-D-alanine ligase
MKLTLGEIAEALETTVGSSARVAEGYSTDSRTVQPGDLFFAIRGPRFDGHDFVLRAIEAGAAGAVVRREFYGGASAELRPPLIPVADTTEALQRLSQSVRGRWGRPLVAITGSAGKSTTKEMAAAILAQRFTVHKSKGNLNNHLGVPLTLLSLEAEHEVAVAELAMSGAGEIALLTRLAAPNVGVVTNVAPVHLQFFDSVDGIARAKRELIENLPSGAKAVLNFDDARVRSFAAGFAGEILTFGLGEGADVRALDVRPDVGQGCRFRVHSARFEAEIHLPLAGRHNVQNALAAMAAASLLGASGEDARAAMENFQPLAQRSEILTLPSGGLLINDCYNSNPLAMERMLETLANWPGARRRVVVAGEMLELGPESPNLHRAVGRKCAEIGVDWLIAVQGDAKFMIEGAREAGLPPAQMQFFQTPEAAAAFCAPLVLPGDLLLVKGSRGVHLEKLVDILRAAGPDTKGALSARARG